MIARRKLTNALALLAILFFVSQNRAQPTADALYRVSIQQSVSVKMGMLSDTACLVVEARQT